MLFIKRDDLSHLMEAIEVALLKLRTYDNKAPMFTADLEGDKVEAVALSALNMRLAMELGRADSVQPADVAHLNGMQPLFEPPKLD